MDDPEEMQKALNAPRRVFVQESKAMPSTPADVKEYPLSYSIIDMPSLKSGDITIHVEDDNVLVISGERKREDEKDAKYVRMERRVGKFMRKFPYRTMLTPTPARTVTVQKLPPPKPKKPRLIEVKVA